MNNSATTRHSAFTLIELLVVLAIIALLSALLFPAFKRAQESGNQTNCVSNLNQIHIAVNQYLQDTKRYPDSLVDLLPDDAQYDNGVTPAPTTPATIVNGTGYLKGGTDILRCPDDDLDTLHSSYGAMVKSPATPTPEQLAEVPGRYVFNYWGYKDDGFIFATPTEAQTASVTPATNNVLLRNPNQPYDPLNNPIKYSLSNRYAPTSTIITHCVYHRVPTANDLALPTDLYATPAIGDGTGARDIVLRVDGTAKLVDVSQWKTQAPNPSPWQVQR